jgi:TctA family transporter
MARSGRAGVALLVTAVGSFVGGSIGIVLLMAFTPAVVALAMAFGPAEYVAMMVLCLMAAAMIGSATPARGLAMVLLGGLLGTVGTDIYDGTDRFTFGLPNLLEGIELAPLAMGLFGVSEIIASIRGDHGRVKHRIGLRAMLPTAAEARAAVLPMLRGAGIGSVFGPLPGTGPTIATIASYAVERGLSRTPERFGAGAVEGVAAPESANNAAVQTAFIPTLSLGIPGTPTMAIIIGALMMHGIIPGPALVDDHPELFWGLVASFWIGNLLLLVLNIPLIGLWVGLLNIPYRYLYPAIIVLIAAGAYSLNRDVFDLWVVMAFAVLGYGMQRWGFHPAPLLIGFILAPMLEENFRRAMILGRGDAAYLIDTPIAATLWAVTLAVALVPPLRRLLARRRPVRP